MNAKSESRSFRLRIPTAAGEFVAGYSGKGLATLDFPERGQLPECASNALPADVEKWHRLTAKALIRALAGKQPGPLPPLDLSEGSSFQQMVWMALCTIAPGQTRSYGEIARAIGRPRAVRAVGGACGANPIPVIIPCHRVLAANQKLGGFSGGLKWKKTLLASEGVISPS